MNNKCVVYDIALIVPDRVGMLRDVTEAIVSRGGNLLDLRRVIVAGAFSLTCAAEFHAGTTIEDVRAAIEAGVDSLGAGLMVLPHKPAAEPVVAHGSRYVFTILGPDGAGRVFDTAHFFMERGINIEEWRHVVPAPGEAFNIGLVTIPDELDFRAVQSDFVARMSSKGLAGRLLHENIFRATNEIGPIHDLLPDVARAARSGS